GLNGRLRGEVRLHVVIQLTLGNRSRLGQGRIALHVAFGAPEFGLRLAQLRLDLRERRLERTRVDLEKDLSFADHRALAIVATHEITRYLRAYPRVAEAIQRRYPLVGNGYGFGLEGDDRHSRRWRWCGRRFAPAARLDE